jgi:hypothetical protein
MKESVLRAGACVIALLGLVDPLITSSRPVRAVVSLVGAPGLADSDRALMDRVAGVLGTRFVVTRGGLSADAVAVVAVGERIPNDADRVAVPAFAVMPEPAGPTVRIEALRAPGRAPVDSHVPLVAVIRVTGASRAQLDVTLTAGGVMVDRVTRRVSSDEERLEIPLSLVPANEGLVAARVTAAVAGSDQASASAVADTALPVDHRAWRVLVFDPRPSWMSTFVRRALEEDPRFAVANRTMTSRTASAGTLDSPTRLTGAAALERFEAIVVGAPDALKEDEVRGLESYLRRRGGAVVLLMDSSRASSSVDRLLGVERWSHDTGAAPFDLWQTSTRAIALRASEVRWPKPLPASAVVLVYRDESTPAVIWQTPVGAGRIVVSGALDAWRHRTSGAVSVDRFWRQAIASAAGATPPPIEIRFEKSVVALGESVRAHIVLTRVALAASQALSTGEVAGAITGPAGASFVRLWPDGPPGQFAAMLPAAAKAGTYRLSVTSLDEQADAEWLVSPSPRAAVGNERDLVRMWTTSRGGVVVHERSLGGLPAAIDRAVVPVRRDQRWYPMRQPWWIVPFTALLGAEWWMRRRSGRA